MGKPATVKVRPLTAKNWPDLEKLFGPRGACAGCWCMTYRLSHSTWKKQQGEKNRRAFQRIVASGVPTGVLAYLGKEPVGWCAVAPREDFPALDRSRVLARVDDAPVWSIVCFFVARGMRHRGMTSDLIEAAVRYARRNGARIVEAYPVEPGAGGTADAFAFTGLASAFRRAGFVEAARRSPRRAVYRLDLTRGR